MIKYFSYLIHVFSVLCMEFLLKDSILLKDVCSKTFSLPVWVKLLSLIKARIAKFFEQIFIYRELGSQEKFKKSHSI